MSGKEAVTDDVPVRMMHEHIYTRRVNDFSTVSDRQR